MDRWVGGKIKTIINQAALFAVCEVWIEFESNGRMDGLDRLDARCKGVWMQLIECDPSCVCVRRRWKKRR